MIWSFLYLVVRNLFALVWLLARPRRSQVLEILVLLGGEVAGPPTSSSSCRFGPSWELADPVNASLVQLRVSRL